MDENELESLLYESEGDELDFKWDQYPLTDNAEKGELIKDILAFANGWRRTDAFILIGVDQAKVAGRSTPVGVTTHLSDSNIQQMVNSKTNQHVSFAYEEVSFKGLDIGVIKIPVQDRPRFLTKDFGRLKKDVVYVRRGSSTAEAGLDEILRMKTGPTTPNLDLQFAHVTGRQSLGKQITVMSEVVDYNPEEIQSLVLV
jgi:predicted HTH transcriptional regulator